MASVLDAIAARRKRGRANTPRPAQPRRFELEYTSALLAVVRSWNREVRAAIEPHIEAHARQDVLLGPAKSAIERMRKKAPALQARASAAATKTARGVDKFAREEMARTVAIPVGKPLANAIESFRQENVELVTSVATRQLDELESLLSDAGSMRVESLRDLVFERFDVSESRAALIARDQVLKLNSQIQQEQQQSVGIQQYVWATARDERVREDHQKLDGTTHNWSDPPVVDSDTGRREHPGRDFQCRCQAIPVIA